MAGTVLHAFHAISLNPCTYCIAYRSYRSPYYTRRGQSSERVLALSVFSAVTNPESEPSVNIIK